MAKPRVLILRAPGTNCNRETAFAFEQAGAESHELHVAQVLAHSETLADFQVLCIPGGFSYGDDIAAGRILGSEIRHRLADALEQFRAAGKLVLGICNGFQVLIRSGILLEEDAAGPPATLTWNESGRFEDRWVRVAAVPSNCVFFAGIESMELPIAHAEGKFVPRDEAALARLTAARQVVLRYAPAAGSDSGAPSKATANLLAYPANPNGSHGNVAGVCDASGRVCGIMPHPERHIDFTQHPRWTRRAASGEPDGMAVFRNAVGYFR